MATKRCRECGNQVHRRGLCRTHDLSRHVRDELAFFDGYHATDERIATWMGVTTHAVERLRERSR